MIKSELFPKHFFNTGNNAFWACGFLGLFACRGWRTGNCSLWCRSCLWRNFLECTFRVLARWFEPPRKSYLIGILVLAYPVCSVHITPILCLFYGVLMILGKMYFALEGDQLLIYLPGDFYFFPAHNSSYSVSRDTILNASLKKTLMLRLIGILIQGTGQITKSRYIDTYCGQLTLKKFGEHNG